MSFAQSYLGQLRALTGPRPLLAAGARVLIEDDQGRFLVIKRTDDGAWGFPGGAMELGESLMDVVHREAFEEAHAQLRDVTPFGISSDPTVETHTYPNGDVLQNVTLLAHGFAVNDDLRPNDDEASQVRFVHPKDIEKAGFSRPEFPTLRHWEAFKATGVFQIV